MISFIYKYRFLTLMWEVLRYLWHKTIGPCVEDPFPVWYDFDKTPKKVKNDILPINDKWHTLHRQLYLHEQVFYNIDNALATNKNLKGIALVFFMGLGDYLYTTPLIEALAKKYTNLTLYAYVSKVLDRNNSPLVAKLLNTNPYIKKVEYFDGQRNPVFWKNYLYQNCKKTLPKDFLLLPVYYDYKVNTPHRVASLFQTFNLQYNTKKENLRPIFYFKEKESEQFYTLLNTLEKSAQNKKGIIFLQLDSRASFYTYPHIDELINKLIEQNFLVLSVTKANVKNPNFILLDIKQFSFNENCHFLHILKQKFPLYIIALNSVFWAASAGLNIKNLGLQHWIDPKVHNLWYDNITMMTEVKYKKIPSKYQIIVSQNDFVRHNKKIIDFTPSSIIKNLLNIIEKQK